MITRFGWRASGPLVSLINDIRTIMAQTSPLFLIFSLLSFFFFFSFVEPVFQHYPRSSCTCSILITDRRDTLYFCVRRPTPHLSSLTRLKPTEGWLQMFCRCLGQWIAFLAAKMQNTPVRYATGTRTGVRAIASTLSKSTLSCKSFNLTTRN